MGNRILTIKDTSLMVWALRLIDSTVLTATGLVVYAFYVRAFPLDVYYKAAFVTGFLLALLIFPAFDIYTSWRGRNLFQQFQKVVLACVTLFIILMVTSVALKGTVHYSRVWFFTWAGTGTLGLIVYREILFSVLGYFRKRGWNLKPVVIIGNEQLNLRVMDRIQKSDWTGFQVVRVLNQPHIENVKDFAGSTEGKELVKYILHEGVQEIWVTYALKDSHHINDLLFLTRHMPQIKFRYIPDISDFQILLNNSVSEIEGMVTLELNHSPLEGANRFVKEIEDRVLAAIILVLISPLLALISLAIKLESRGPAIYKQRREGWGGHPINVYKFRSMYYKPSKEDQFVQATKNDTRVTKVGAFLRRTSLDELPQFYNVLQGRMSIVGPRPHVDALNKQYMDLVENYFTRNKVKPGITGWAQINGWRGETDTVDKMQKRVEFDLYYIQNWSLWFDLKIIFLTIFRGFMGKNAY